MHDATSLVYTRRACIADFLCGFEQAAARTVSQTYPLARSLAGGKGLDDDRCNTVEVRGHDDARSGARERRARGGPQERPPRELCGQARAR